MKANHITINIGSLPEWYNEELHDPLLESEIESKLEAIFSPDTIQTYYVYDGPHSIQFHNEDGDEVANFIVNLDHIFHDVQHEYELD